MFHNVINNLPFSGAAPLEQDVLDGNLDEFHKYADKLYNINHERFENNQFKGRSFLHHAAQKSHLELVKQLVENSEDKNPQDEHGITPLHLAASFGHLEIIKCLLPLASDKNPKAGAQFAESTPLHLATMNGHLYVIQYLLENIQGDINPSMSNGFTVLHEAAEKGHLNVVSLYTSRLPDPNPGILSNDKCKGITPLHQAAEKGHLAMVKHIASFLEDKNPKS